MVILVICVPFYSMQAALTAKSIFHHWQTPVLLIIFFVVRLLSFLLAGHTVLQAIIVFCVLMTLGILYFKNPNWAFYIVLGELFLGGSGELFQFIDLSLRSLLIVTFLGLWALDIIVKRELKPRAHLNKTLSTLLIAFYALVFFAFANGLLHGHAIKNAVQDLVPFFYLPLLFPAYHLLAKKEAHEYFVRLLIVFLIGSAIFSVVTFVLFSGGIIALQEPFYKWFRDVALGKITDLGNGFFRVVLPEHLLITPIILIISSLLMRDERHHHMWRFLLFLALTILMLNFSRIYLIALVVGLIVLKYKHKWHRWFIISGTTLGLAMLIFTSFAMLASGGKTFGWELLGIRVTSLTAPAVEVSSATRMMILPSILEIIKSNPIFGIGLGATVTFFNTMTFETITTRHFDWGYLEMLAELGAFGTLTFLALIVFTMSTVIKKIKSAVDWQDFYVGLLAGIAALLVINITAPTLFHVFGIFFFVFTIAIAMKPMDIFENMITLLYRIFNRLKTK